MFATPMYSDPSWDVEFGVNFDIVATLSSSCYYKEKPVLETIF